MKYCGAVLTGVFLIFLSLSCGYSYGEETQATVPEQKPPVKAEEAPPAVTGTATMGVFNKYIFRGYELSRNSAVFEPSLTASYEGFSASFWGNIDSRENGDHKALPRRLPKARATKRDGPDFELHLCDSEVEPYGGMDLLRNEIRTGDPGGFRNRGLRCGSSRVCRSIAT